MTPTFLAGAVPEARARAVADEAVPPLLADAVVPAGLDVALLPRRLRARVLDARHVLRLGDLADVLAAPVDEQVPDAAHVAVVEHGGPELGGQHQTRPAAGQTPQVKVALQVQDLIFSAGRERRPAAVYRDDAWREGKQLCSKRHTPEKYTCQQHVTSFIHRKGNKSVGQHVTCFQLIVFHILQRF